MSDVTNRQTPSTVEQARRAMVVSVVVAAGNLAIYGMARLAGVSLVVPPPGGGRPARVPIGAVVAASVLAVALAATALWLLRRFWPERAIPAFLVVAVAFFAMSLSAPAGLDTSTSNKLLLATMHVLTLVLTVVGLTLGRSKPKEP